MNNKYKIIFDKIKEEGNSDPSSLKDLKEIQELAEMVMEINQQDLIQTYTTS